MARAQYQKHSTATRVRVFMEEHPETKQMNRAEILKLLKKAGIRKATLSLITYARSKQGEVNGDGEIEGLAGLMEVKRLADKMGGIDVVKRHLGILEKVRA